MDRAVERVDHGHRAIFTGQRPRSTGRRPEAVMEAVFRDYRRILLAMAAVLAATVAVELLVAPGYRADAELLVLPQPGQSPEAALRSEIDILQSRTLAVAVVDAVGARRLYPDVGAVDPSARAMRRFGHSLDVAADGDVLMVGFSNPDPAIAARAADQVLAAYFALRSRLFDNDRGRVLAAQAAELRDRLEKAEQAYAGFTAAHGSRYDTRIDILLHRQDSLEHDLDQASIESDEARTKLQTQAQVQAQAQRTVETSRLAQVQGSIAALEAQEPDFLRLRQQRDLAAANYQAAAQALGQSRIAGLRPGAATVRVLQPAVTPRRSPRLRLLILAMGLLLSLLAAILTAWLCARFRRGFIDAVRMERDIGLPVLSSIEEWPRLERLPALEKIPQPPG